MSKLYIHFSIDDVINCFLWLNRNNANSIFESEILNFTRRIHREFDIGTTLNCMYLNSEEKYLSEVSSKWKEEFEDNSEWLKLAFHCYGPESDYSKTLDKSFADDYKKTVREMCRIAGNAVDNSIVRLHYFHGSSSVVDYLYQSETKCLLAADDSRVSYDLTSDECKILEKYQEYDSPNRMKYVSTDFRVEKYDGAIEYRKNADRIVFFTHESFLMNTSRS